MRCLLFFVLLLLQVWGEKISDCEEYITSIENYPISVTIYGPGFDQKIEATIMTPWVKQIVTNEYSILIGENIILAIGTIPDVYECTLGNHGEITLEYANKTNPLSYAFLIAALGLGLCMVMSTFIVCVFITKPEKKDLESMSTTNCTHTQENTDVVPCQ
jgi:hypothetical protein